ncbi:PIF1-like helicase domain-containing protein [Hirsutella rhossiliensis]|uniref:ATP-dependent DNA helicase n=1 Tax=Hirsutella rhossiliensis TaxID=111463 RepID=A0A9P8MM64_9HYPO|nr:PIF1-like helicase domain-containing protein [Hirsutella rhossiliensis]KAH0957700.1 PIF1-like helicase domain-containing protein [Hirsutella rhossiliensis]
MDVRSKNRRVSMLSATRKNFAEVERIVRSLTADRLAAARAELETSGKTTDDGVKELLRCLSLYGYRQPMSRELRLSMRRKIQSLILCRGVPAIWFTLNPNDITNPGNVHLSSMLADIDGEDQAAYRERIVRYVDSVFPRQDLDQEGFCAMQAERSPDLRQVLAGQKGRKGDLCRFKAPWGLVDETAFTGDGVLRIRRSHSMVNRWNKAIAVGLRHNHDISFIVTQRKTMALIFYVTNYATKVEDPVWKRVAAAADLLPPRAGDGMADGAEVRGDSGAGDDGRQNKTRQFLMKVANRVFTERPLSAWAFLNVLRRPGKQATVCLDGYLSKDFDEDDEGSCYRRAAVQHLALFVPWTLAPRISCFVDNVQLLRRSAEDAKRDARQWAASSGDGDPTAVRPDEDGTGEVGVEPGSGYQADSAGSTNRLIDVVRSSIGPNQITAGSPELTAMMQELSRFQQSALSSSSEVQATILPERGPRRINIPGGHSPEPPYRRKVSNVRQLCQFVGGEGGTGKSRVIEALVELFASKDQSNRLMITATSGTAAARINGITIHSACGFSKDLAAAANAAKDLDGVRLPKQAERTAVSWDVDSSFKAETRHQHDKAHALWKRFTTTVMLDEQDRSDLDLLNSRCYREGRRIPWETCITVVTPLNRNRWNLNMEASLAFRAQQRSVMRIFISDHTWKEALPTEEEAIMMLNQGDDSAIPVPAVFMFVPGMPVVVNHNTHQGLKLVNGAGYTALEVVLDKSYPGHRITADTTVHFGPPAGIMLESETTNDVHFCQRKRPWQQNDVSRKGLPCTAAFACTDYKVQGRTLERVALELRGTRTSNIDGRAVSSQCDPYSLYVQLSRCPTLDGIMLVSKLRERDLVGNKVPDEMTDAEARLGQLSDKTVREASGWLDVDSLDSKGTGLDV